jgi:tricorn protease-like protein
MIFISACGLRRTVTRGYNGILLSPVPFRLLLCLFLGISGLFLTCLPASRAVEPEGLPEGFLPKGSFGLRVTFSPVKPVLALTGMFDCNSGQSGLILWDVKEDVKLVVMHKELILVQAFAFTPDGKRFVTVHRQGTHHREGDVKLWDADTCKKLADLGVHDSIVDAVAISPEGKWLATGGRDGQVLLWDLFTRKLSHTLPLHSNAVASLSFSPDGTVLASASPDGKLLLTNVKTRELIGSVMRQDKQPSSFSAVRFSPDGRSLASGGPEPDKVTVWDTSTRNRKGTFHAHEGIIDALAFDPSGSLLASGCQNGTLIVRDIKSKKIVLFQKFQSSIRSLSISPDGRLLAVSIGDDQVELWDLATGKQFTHPKQDD